MPPECQWKDKGSIAWPAIVMAGWIPALRVRAYAHAVVLDLRAACSAMRMIQSAL